LRFFYFFSVFFCVCVLCVDCWLVLLLGFWVVEVEVEAAISYD
jgi:hypothetical protein